MADALNPVDDVFLNDEGLPIGQLALADATAVAPVDEAGAEAADALGRSKEEELGADLALYPGYDDMDLRQRARSMYVADGARIAAIALAVGLPERTVAMWAYNERWDSLARKELAARDAEARLELARMRTERRNPVAAEQLDEAKRIRKAALEAVEGGKIKGGTDAWAAAAKVEQTILGIKEGGDLAASDGREDAQGEKDGGKKPLVVIFNGGLPQASRRQQ